MHYADASQSVSLTKSILWGILYHSNPNNLKQNEKDCVGTFVYHDRLVHICPGNRYSK